jgi:hypothetical protein
LKDAEAWFVSDPFRVPADSQGNALARVNSEREFFLIQIRNFREYLQWIYDPRGYGKPVDFIRTDLEEHIGNALFHAGIQPTSAKDGVFARVLRDAVYPAVGLQGTAEKAVRMAIQYRHDWRGGKRVALTPSKHGD